MLARRFVMRLSHYTPKKPGERPTKSIMAITGVKDVFFLVLERTIIDLLARFGLVCFADRIFAMHLSRTPEALIEVMCFAVARKMLITSDTFIDLILGVAALAGLFAIRRYLEHVPAQCFRFHRRRRISTTEDWTLRCQSTCCP